MPFKTLTLIALVILLAPHKTCASIMINFGLWPKGQTIVIRVQGADPRDISCLEESVARYSEIIPIDFTFYSAREMRKAEHYDVNLQIVRGPAKGWSTKGQGLLVDEKMQIGIPQPGLCSPGIKGLILHEFGHLLGLAHEHQHPHTPPKDTQLVIKRYKGKLEEHNFHPFNSFELLGYRYTNYDPHSVMHYLRKKNDLSPGDIKMLQDTYGRR